MGGKDPRPKKELPAWTKKKPDVVTVNPGPSKEKNFKHTPPAGQNNFAGPKTNMPVGNIAAVFNFNSKKRQNIK